MADLLKAKDDRHSIRQARWSCKRTRLALAVATTMGLLASPSSAEPLQTTIGASATTVPFLGQRERHGFASDFEFWSQLDGDLGLIDYSVRLSYTGTNDEAELRLDGSRLALRGELWSIALGAQERKWSFSPNTSLIWSRNARPVPALTIERTRAASDAPLLGWIGDWSGEIVFGKLDGKQPDPNISMFGARLEINPLPGLDVELVRTAQWGGDGQRDGLDAFWDMLIGNSNQSAASGDDPANQLAGIGVSYAFPQEMVPLRLYMQAIGEDEASGLPSCFMYLMGAEWNGVIGSMPTTVVAEGINTVIALTDGGFCGPETAYLGQYSRGYSHFGTVIGAAVDTAGQSVGFDVVHDFGQHTVGWGASQVLINDINAPSHRLSSERVKGATGYVSYLYDFGEGTLEAGINYQGFDLDNASLGEGFGASLSYAYSF